MWTQDLNQPRRRYLGASQRLLPVGQPLRIPAETPRFDRQQACLAPHATGSPPVTARAVLASDRDVSKSSCDRHFISAFCPSDASVRLSKPTSLVTSCAMQPSPTLLPSHATVARLALSSAQVILAAESTTAGCRPEEMAQPPGSRPSMSLAARCCPCLACDTTRSHLPRSSCKLNSYISPSFQCWH